MISEVAVMNERIPAAIALSTTVRRVPVVEADPGDTVVFSAGSDTISVWFPEPGVFPTSEIVTMQTGDIEVEVPTNATPGTYSYVIYVHTAHNYAECNSHPLMIIKGP